MKSSNLIDYKRMSIKFREQVEYKTRKLVFKKNTAQKHCFIIQ